VAAPDPEQPAETPAAPPGNKSKRVVVFAGLGLALLAIVGVAAWLLLPRLTGAKAAGAAPKPAVVVKATVALGPVVVNLSGEPKRYVRAAVSLGVPGPKDAKEVEEARPQLTDLLIAVLADADADALLSAEGRDAIKDDLLTRIREDLGLHAVARVYLTEYVVQ
jgi:flagellar FliL protein